MSPKLASAQPPALVRILWPMMLPLLLIVTLVGYLSYSEILAQRLRAQDTLHIERLSRVNALFNRELGNMRNLIRLLESSARMQMALPAASGPDLELLDDILLRFVRNAETVSQARWLDMAGDERARANLYDGQAVIVRREQLQNKASRYYVREAQASPPGQVYVSPLDLNVENGTIVRPFEPTLRAVIRTGDGDGLQPGMLIINFNLTELFQQVRALADGEIDIELLDQDGYWLINPDPAMEWGAQLERPQLYLANLEPGLWQLLEGETRSGIIIVDGRLWRALHLDYDNPTSESGKYLLLLAGSLPGWLDATRRAVVLPVLVTCLSALLVGFLFIRHLALIRYHRHCLQLALEQEKTRLEDALAELQQAHVHQQLLQDELVESRKLASLGMMVAGVAHELNTPTGGALMNVSTLRSGLSRLETSLRQGLTRRELEAFMARSSKALDLADRNLQRAAELIRSFKRLAIDRSANSVERFDLSSVLHDLVNTLQPRLKRLPVRLAVSETGSVQMHSYPGILSQTLQNLIENALAHAFEPGCDGVIELVAESMGKDRVRLEVRDNGRGIAPELLDSLFDPFVTSGRGRGHTGLGLHLVHQWVYQVLRGSLSVETASGEGSCFTLLLPVRVE